jgi:hypothetical protein
MAVTHTTVFRSAVANLIGDNVNSGKLVFRITGSTADTPATAAATLTLNADAFPNSTNGTLTANAITSDTNAAGGTVAFATIQSSTDVVKVHCAVAASGSDIDMSNGLVVAPGDTVSCSSLTYTAMP